MNLEPSTGCITWKCEEEREGNTLYCEECLMWLDAEAARRNRERKKLAEEKECVYCGESGDSKEDGNLVPVPQEHWVPWAHQGCIVFEEGEDG